MSAGALGWSLVHALWQGALVALALAAALALIDRRAASLRYLVSTGALALLVLLPVATFVQVRGQASPPPGASANALVAALPAAGGAAVPIPDGPSGPAQLARRIAAALTPALPAIVAAWLAGVLALSLRLAGGWLRLRRLVSAAPSPAPGPAREALRRLADQMGVRRAVRLSACARVGSPMVVGWLRPAVLVPPAAFFGLDPAQLEAVLAHELAHVRRHDYLVNLLQSVVETLLFYHPAAWWISRQVRLEREHCCDDAGAAACGDPLLYARALVRLEELRRPAPRLAVAAAGPARGASLLSRARRLLEPGAPRSPLTVAAPLAVLTAALLAAGLGAGALAAGPEETPSAADAGRVESLAPPPAGFSPEERALLARYTVTGDYVQGLERAGLTGLSADELVTLRRYGVDGAYVAALARLGYPGLSVERLAALSRYSVAPEWVERVQEAGYRGVPAETLVTFRRYGVDEAVLERLHAAGERPTPEELVSLVRYGLLGPPRTVDLESGEEVRP